MLNLGTNRQDSIQAVIDCIWSHPGEHWSDEKLFTEYVKQRVAAGESEDAVTNQLADGIAAIIDAHALA